MTQEQFGVRVVSYQQMRADYRQRLRTGTPLLLMCVYAIGLEFHLALKLHSWLIWAFAGLGTVMLIPMVYKTYKMFLWWRGMDRVCKYGAQAATLKTQGQVDCAIDQFNAAVNDYNQIGP